MRRSPMIKSGKAVTSFIDIPSANAELSRNRRRRGEEQTLAFALARRPSRFVRDDARMTCSCLPRRGKS